MELLQDTVTDDPSADVRGLALRALADHPEVDSQQVRAAAELALEDPELAVEHLANEILEQLEGNDPLEGR